MSSIINGVTVNDGNDFEPIKKTVIAAEMINGYGSPIGDFVRDYYTLEYKWDALDPTAQAALLAATDAETYPTFSVTHPTMAGDHTGTYRVTSPLRAKKLKYSNRAGGIIWTDVSLSLEELKIV